jgi:hypothetical protein
MPRKKKPAVEIVPASEAALVPKPATANLQAMLDRMVRDKVDEIMAERAAGQSELAHQPREIRRHHPGFERVKWPLYFEKWGCEVCGRKRQVSHGSKGRCATCVLRLYHRMQRLEREWVRNNPESQIAEDIDRLTRRFRSAQEL